MDLGLKGKVAVVSGSTAGIGLAIATTLAREGAHVILNGRTEERVDKALKTVRTAVSGAQVHGVAADLGAAEGIAKFVRQVPTADVLVNNLGIFEPKPFLEISDKDWLRFYEVNVMSGVRLTRHYLPGMISKNWGRVIFISSESGQQTPGEMVHYGMDQDRANRRGAWRRRIRCGHRDYSKFNSGRPDRFRRCRRFRSVPGRAAGNQQRTSREGIFRKDSPQFAAEAIRNDRRSCRSCRVCCQHSSHRHQRSSSSRRRRRGPQHFVIRKSYTRWLSARQF